MKKLLFSLVFLPLYMLAQQAPVFGIQDVFKDTVVLSWVVPATSTSTVIERATDRNFTSPTTVYNGTYRFYVDRGLTAHTWYYYRCKSGYAGSVFSAWVVDSVHTFWTPTAASQGGHRVATSGDLALDPLINVGDYLIVGSDSYPENDLWGASVGGFLGLSIPNLTTPGSKVCVLGDIGYDFLNINMVNNRGKTVTNIGGQVKSRLIFLNNKQVLFTGKYDPVNKTGNSRYLGYDGDFSKLSGSFGFYIKGRWDHPEVLLSHMGGQTDSSTFEYIEAGDGGSSAFSIKNDGSAVAMVGNEVRWLYVHDTGDEGFYIGSTQPAPQTPIIDFKIHNIIIARAGLNALQIGNMKGFNWIHNLATVGGGFEYNNAFMKYQDQFIQLQPRENGYVFDSSIMAGGSGDYLNWFMQPDLTYDNPTTAQTSYIRNNLWYDNKNRGGGFLQVHNSFDGTSIISGNYFGGLAKKKSSFDAYAQLYNENYAKRSTFIGIAADGGSTFTVTSTNNTFDSTVNNPVTILENGTGGTITQTSTTYQNDLPPLVFNNYMDHMVDSSYSKPERWMDKQATKWVRTPLNSCCGYRDSRFGTMFQAIRDANITSSTNSYTLPGILGTDITPTVGTGLAYQTGERVFFYNGSLDATPNFYATITNYNSGSGALSLHVDSVTGSGTIAAWAVRQEIQDIIIRRTYKQNDIVRFEGRWYISLQNNNTSHQPLPYADDSWWKMIIFSNGRTAPPDDLRLPVGDFYAAKGMGLSVQVGSGVRYRFKIPAGHKFKKR
jgi:hypothetical protein